MATTSNPTPRGADATEDLRPSAAPPTGPRPREGHAAHGPGHVLPHAGIIGSAAATTGGKAAVPEFDRATTGASAPTGKP